jgi:hypothetical protein
MQTDPPTAVALPPPAKLEVRPDPQAPPSRLLGALARLLRRLRDASQGGARQAETKDEVKA